MYIQEIALLNFRNYDKRVLKFAEQGSFLCGNNGCGKTNLLESIYLLAYGKSFRTICLDELLMFSKESFGVKGVFNGKREETIEFRFAKGEKRILVNDVEIVNLKELIGNVALVLLSLSDINLVTGEPAMRRRFVDYLLSLLHHDYLSNLLDYRKVLKQRNRILYMNKMGKKNSLSGIDGWTAELVKIGSRIVKTRISIMKDLEQCASFFYTLFASSKDKLAIKYVPSFRFNGNIEKDFTDCIEKRRKDELDRGATLVGPHRDELLITVNNLNARKFASEGEQRSCAISLKVAQASFLKDKRDDAPIILIDEAVAELDITRKEKVLRSVKDLGQCMIATTNCSELNQFLALEPINI